MLLLVQGSILSFEAKKKKRSCLYEYLGGYIIIISCD
jgi:hypothetical protein